MNNTTAAERQIRIEQLEGQINAHARGWTTWTREQVRDMQFELRRLREATRPAPMSRAFDTGRDVRSIDDL